VSCDVASPAVRLPKWLTASFSTRAESPFLIPFVESCWRCRCTAARRQKRIKAIDGLPKAFFRKDFAHFGFAVAIKITIAQHTMRLFGGTAFDEDVVWWVDCARALSQSHSRIDGIESQTHRLPGGSRQVRGHRFSVKRRGKSATVSDDPVPARHRQSPLTLRRVRTAPHSSCDDA